MELALQALVYGLLLGMTYSIIAIGFNLLYGVSGLINFAHGSFFMLGLYIFLAIEREFAWGPYASSVFVVPLFALMGFVLYRLVLRPLIGRDALLAAQLTLGLLFIIDSLLLTVFGAAPKRVATTIGADVVAVGPLSIRAPILIAGAVSLIMTFSFFWLLSRTDFGRAIRAIQQNSKAASMCGIPVERVRAPAMGLALGLVAVAAAVLAPTAVLQPANGLHFTLIALIIVVLGGMGNFVGTLYAGLVIGVTESVGAAFFDSTVASMLPFLVFAAILLVRPAGLVGSQ